MGLPEVHHRHRLRADGFRDDEVQRMLRRGALTPVRRGAYVVGPLPPEAVERHQLEIKAALARMSPDAVVSHVSAAVLHGIPVWAIRVDRVHATRTRHNGGRVRRYLHIHTARLEDRDVTTAHGMPVTSVARTVVDIARSQQFEQALVVADAALFRGLVDGPALAAELDRAEGRPGSPGARRVVAAAEARSESVGETRSRIAISRAGLPVPVPQWPAIGLDGREIGRVDFGWPALRTVGEFDGEIKYGRLLKPGQSAADAVYAEKRREDRIRATGLAVVRWAWDDLDDFRPTAAALRARFTWP